MASIIQIGSKWRAQVRRKGLPAQTQTFDTKILAQKWARRVEAGIDAGVAAGLGPSVNMTLGEIVTEYTEKVGSQKPFGRNKAAVIKMLDDYLGHLEAPALTPERIVDYITEERQVSGVTAAIDLTYLKGMLKFARVMLKANANPGAVDDAREMLKHLGRADRSSERDRRPTLAEIDALKGWFATHSDSLTPDLIDFILDSCFRPPSEIERLRWDDLNHEDKTVVIHDRKDPRKKLGNNQTVPLLGRTWEIIMRQPKQEETGSEFIFNFNGGTWSSIFPRACRALGIADLRLYDLRHEAISRLVESNKYSIPEMMLVTGHKDPKQLMRYTQIRARNLHR